MSIVLMAMVYAFIAAIQGLVTCSQKDEKCGSNPDEQTALHAIVVAVTVVGYFLSIMSMTTHQRKRSVLHPEWKNHAGCCGQNNPSEK